MKKMNRKGFTIVELVIVIAVIAILAGVMIPTFSDVVSKAQSSKTLQQARNLYTEYYTLDISDGKVDKAVNGTAISMDRNVTYTTSMSGDVVVVNFEYAPGNGWKATYNGSSWSTDTVQ